MYAAFVAPDGVTTKINGLQTTGQIYSVAMNSLGNAIVGGGFNNAYAALVASDGTITEVSGAISSTAGFIQSVAINTSGNAIIGGQGASSAPYVALVNSSGVASPLSGPALPAAGQGQIESVAINASGNAIVGGRQNGFQNAYAALVNSSGVTSPISGDFPTQTASAAPAIWTVAINASDVAVIGGNNTQTDGTTTFLYAALVDSTGMATGVNGLSSMTNGRIESVAINDSGTAIIGGAYGSPPMYYAALVAPDGTPIPITGDVPTGSQSSIRTVDISESGIGLIGGFEGGSADSYAALIAPDGTATQIDLLAFPGLGQVGSVSIRDALLSDAVTPNTLVPDSITVFSGFSSLSSQVLPGHFSGMGIRTTTSSEGNQGGNERTALLVDASNVIRGNIPNRDETKYVLWADPFFSKENQKTLSSSSWTVGGMLGFDYQGIKNTIIGVGAAYAFGHTEAGRGRGHANTNQEFLALYGSWGGKHLLIDIALWGGLYQTDNTRYTLNIASSKAHIKGKLLSPHLGLAIPFYAKSDWFIIAPFAMFDWTHIWQRGFQETGASGLNIHVGSQYTSLLRSEAGLRFYEVIRYRWGEVILEEKGSFVNKKPFHTGPQTAFFVGSPSTFNIELFSGKTENLGVVQVRSQFIPYSNRYLYGSVSYQGEFGSASHLHTVIAEIGKRF